MRKKLTLTAFSVGMLVLTAGCDDNPPVPPPLPPGPTQPVPNDDGVVPGYEQSPNIGDPNTPENSSSSSLDFNSPDTTDRYANRNLNSSASQDSGTLTEDVSVTGDVSDNDLSNLPETDD